MVYVVAFCKLNLFNLDSAPTRPGNPDYKPTETTINDNKKERVIKVITGSTVSCMTALMLFYLRSCTLRGDPIDYSK